MAYHAHGFVDGAYLRQLALSADCDLVNPRQLVRNIVQDNRLQMWARFDVSERTTVLTRVTYYDASPEEESEIPAGLVAYWNAVELLPSTDLGFGTLRGRSRRRPRRQKGVDTLLAVDMLVGAFTDIFSVAILVTGDADFVPVVNEVRRRGVAVAVAAEASTLAEDLKRSADLYLAIGPQLEASKFPPMKGDPDQWNARTVMGVA